MSQPWFPSPQCPPTPCPPPWPPCPPPTFSPPTPPWYPGANAGVSFGTQFPPNPCRGHFLWDGQALWMWDGVAWQRVGPAAAGSAGIPEAPIDGNLYGRENAAWVQMPVQGGKIITTFYNASGLITIPGLATIAMVSLWGASGGSGGTTAGASGGTGAGGYLEKYLTGLVPGNTLSFTQAIAGSAGAVGTGNGGSAGATTLSSGSQSIGTLTCNGSNGSLGANSLFTSGTAGGTASGGDMNVTGQAGSLGFNTGTPTADIIQGGSTFFAQGANGVESTPAVGGNPGYPGGLKITWVIPG